MLTLLHIENLAVIERADISFEPGLNILTGETGAGKSILIDALGAVLGQRMTKDIVRSGASAAAVSALFSPLSGQALRWLNENGIDAPEGELLISRNISTDGRSLCRINGKPSTVMLLKNLGSLLVNIHGQHDSQQLLSESTHLSYLDSFAGTSGFIGNYTDAYMELCRLERKLKSLQMDEAEKSKLIDSLKFKIEDIESAELDPDELEELQRERNVLQNSGKISKSLQSAYYMLEGDDELDGICSALASAVSSIKEAADIADDFAETRDRLEEIMYAAQDISSELYGMLGEYEYSADDIDEIEGRLSLISTLTRKYGCPVDELIQKLGEFKSELKALENADEQLAEHRESRGKQLKKARAAANELREARQKAALALERRITDELVQLDMSKVQFKVEVLLHEENGRIRLGPTGTDIVRFLISTNAGEPLKPLSKVASGGELARIMLAMKNVLVSGDGVDTLIFDEVDSGVSGRAALRVGEKLAQAARIRQVLCVTHLPQIAAAAGAHFRILKTETDDKTTTAVERLSFGGRVDEIARLIGGSIITDTTRRSAEELIANLSNH